MRSFYATCLDFSGKGVLFEGPPGSGKSDLALRLIGSGEAKLVSDDQVRIDSRAGERPKATPSPEIAGLMEMRGLGVVTVPCVPETSLALAFRLVSADSVPRMPSQPFPRHETWDIPCLFLDPWAPSAPLKVQWALKIVTGEARVAP